MPVLCSVNISAISALPIWNSWKSTKDGQTTLEMISWWCSLVTSFFSSVFCCGLIPKTYTERVMKMHCYTYDNGPIIGLMSIDPAHVTITSCFFLFSLASLCGTCFKCRHKDLRGSDGFPFWISYFSTSFDHRPSSFVFFFFVVFHQLALTGVYLRQNPWKLVSHCDGSRKSIMKRKFWCLFTASVVVGKS